MAFVEAVYFLCIRKERMILAGRKEAHYSPRDRFPAGRRYRIGCERFIHDLNLKALLQAKCSSLRTASERKNSSM
jgi:hypothetical protein